MQKRINPKNGPAQTTSSGLLKAARNRIIVHACLAIFTIVIVVILLFAMTTAWYSNVVETSGLVFEAEAWGFEGDVVVQEEAIEAVPGDSGVVDLTIVNNSDDVSAITVNVTKEYMSPMALQQRIYFYIDQQQVVNGETVNKHYLSNTSGYSYTLFSQNTMILTEDLHTDSLLKWEWVYDVVGYYFRGTVTETESGVERTVEEYLRPVEYNYDLATYTTDEDDAQENDPGQLVTIDGETTRNQFLAQVTAVDGYEGAFTVGDDDVLKDQSGREVASVGGCYPIYSDEDQQIWLYLCTKSEIEENTRWDTNFGLVPEDEEPKQFYARITVNAQQLTQQAVSVSNPAVLAESLNSAEGGIVRLESDMVISAAVEMDSEANAILDLNGHNLTYTGGDKAFVLEDGGKLTVINGTVKGDGEKESTAFYTVGGQVTMSNLVIEDVYMAVNMEDHKSTSDKGANSFVKIVDCQITTEDISVKINGDGALSGEKTHLIIQDSTLVSEEYVGIMGNGNSSNPGNWGTDIQILNSTVSGYYAGIYHPQQQSNLTISESEIFGYTGMAIKGGDILVMDSTIRGTAATETVPTQSMLSGSGFVDTGDGIYVETDYEQPITIRISGDKSNVYATAGKSLRVFPEANYVQIQITGGLYKDNVSAYLGSGYTCGVTSAGYYMVKAE